MPKLSSCDNNPQKNKNTPPPPEPKPKDKKFKKAGEVDLEIKV